jgi:hypothetical protein
MVNKDLQPSRISLEPFTGLRWYNRLKTADQIASAGYYASNLLRELPIPAEVYAHTIPTYRRLGRIASKMKQDKIDAYVIREEESNGIGVASFMPLKPEPNLLESEHTAEISYWHHDLNRDSAIKCGNAIVKLLLYASSGPAARKGVDTGWMVTLQDDRVKDAVMRDSGFEPIDTPQVFQIDDRVTEPRQLWARSIEDFKQRP